MADISSVETLKNLVKEIETAKLEAGVYEKQLRDLLPLRKEIEKTSEDKYKRKITELPEYKEKLEEKLATLVGELESELNTAKESNPEE